jgi:hypothetical protein
MTAGAPQPPQASLPGPRAEKLGKRPSPTWGPVPLSIAGASFAFAAILIQRFPVIYWGDPYARLEHRHQLLVDRWLPLLQLLVDGVAVLTPDLTAVRLTLAAVGALTVLAGYRLAARVHDSRSAGVFAVLLATNPLFVALAIVPYQEILFAGLVFAGLAAHVGRRGAGPDLRAALLFNLACLTRYESWVLVGLLALFEARRVRPTARAFRTAVALAARYGWTAAAWILILTGTHNLGRLAGATPPPRQSLGVWGHALFHQLRWQLASDVLFTLALVGVAGALAKRGRARVHASFALCFALASLGIIFFANPYSPENLRLTFIPLVFILFYAALGLVFILERIVGELQTRHRDRLVPAAAGLATAALAVVCAPHAGAFVAAAANELDARTMFQVAQRLETTSAAPGPTRIVMLSADPFYASVLAIYSGVPRDRIVTSPARRLRADARYVIDVRLPKATLSDSAALWRADLESGAVLAASARVDAAVVWTLQGPVEK